MSTKENIYTIVFWAMWVALLGMLVWTWKYGAPYSVEWKSYERGAIMASQYAVQHGGEVPSNSYRWCAYEHPTFDGCQLAQCAKQKCLDMGFSDFDCTNRK